MQVLLLSQSRGQGLSPTPLGSNLSCFLLCVSSGYSETRHCGLALEHVVGVKVKGVCFQLSGLVSLWEDDTASHPASSPLLQCPMLDFNEVQLTYLLNYLCIEKQSSPEMGRERDFPPAGSLPGLAIATGTGSGWSQRGTL